MVIKLFKSFKSKGFGKYSKAPFSTEEIAESYGNVMNITTMGWINCDRFYDKPDEVKADIQILAEYDPNTAIFVVFEDKEQQFPSIEPQ